MAQVYRLFFKLDRAGFLRYITLENDFKMSNIEAIALLKIKYGDNTDVIPIRKKDMPVYKQHDKK